MFEKVIKVSFTAIQCSSQRRRTSSCLKTNNIPFSLISLKPQVQQVFQFWGTLISMAWNSSCETYCCNRDSCVQWNIVYKSYQCPMFETNWKNKKNQKWNLGTIATGLKGIIFLLRDPIISECTWRPPRMFQKLLIFQRILMHPYLIYNTL